MAFSDKEQATIRKALVNFFERIGAGKANDYEVAVFPHVLNTLVSEGRINLGYHSNLTPAKSKEASS